MLKHFMSLLLVVCLLLLASCSSTPDKTGSKTTQDLSAKELLKLAESKSSPERESLIMDAAQLYLDTAENKKANQLLRKLDPEQLSDKNFEKYTYLAAQLAIASEDYHQAQDILSSDRLEKQWQHISFDSEKKLRELRAQTFDKLGNIQASVSERIKLAVVLTNKQEEAANQEALWQSLMKMNFVELQNLAANQSGDAEKGWYSLAAIAKNHQVDLDTQQEMLHQWTNDIESTEKSCTAVTAIRKTGRSRRSVK
jgi:uncharacterized protein